MNRKYRKRVDLEVEDKDLERRKFVVAMFL